MAGTTNTHFAVAVHVLTYLAGTVGRPVSSDELAGSANVNPVHVRRVMGPLREAGVVRSRPGAQGGWELARPARRIRLDEVWSVVHGGGPLVGSHGPNPDCPVGAGVAHVLDDLDADVSAAVLARLRRRTVADILAEAVGAAGSVEIVRA